jgi:magnesium transporter
MTVRKAAALAVSQVGFAAFFVAGVTRSELGESAAWFVLAVALLGRILRSIDVESWTSFIPGGLSGRLQHAFGPRAATAGATARLVERSLLAALACATVGQYGANVAVKVIAGWDLTGHLRHEDLATVIAVVMVGAIWLRARTGLYVPADAMARGVWVGIAILALTTVWGIVTVLISRPSFAELLTPPAPVPTTGWLPLDWPLAVLIGLAIALPAAGGAEPVARVAHELPPPRVQAMGRIGRLISLFTLVVTSFGAFLFVVIVPATEHAAWASTPLVGLAQHFAGPSWARGLWTLALVVAALLVLLPAARTAFEDAEQILQRLSSEGRLSERLALLHVRYGTPSHAIDLAAAATILVLFASAGRVTWLAHAYAMSIATTTVLGILALVRLRRQDSRTPSTRASADVPQRPVRGLVALAVLLGTVELSMLVARDGPTIATALALAALFALFTSVTRPVPAAALPPESDALDYLPAADLSLAHVDVRPGNVLVPVRNPHALGHVIAALQTPADRDVVVMTVRLPGIDVSDDDSVDPKPTASERRLLSEVLAVAERRGRPVRLLVVPAQNVADAIVTTIIRLNSSDVHVGESSTLSGEEQARLLGEAWERAAKPDSLDVRLVVHHRTGRTDTYHMGAHPPSLTPGDLDLIHRIWLDVTKAIGPHVHHHDVVRGALTLMEQQLNGPERDEALAIVRQVARVADELAAFLRARDYAGLRDMLRNRHAGDVAAILADLSLDDQVIVFRVLPRKDAAAVFEYLSHEAKEALLKAMAQEDVAGLLNAMAPDDRTMFLEELPASATRQLLNLLTPQERAVAVTLLGYPERSIGRLMTPHYVAVHEHWTVREVLNHVRAHGQDSETLNVIYVVDEEGLLIDDVRIREFLLAAEDRLVSDLMDRQFVALKATDDQEAAVSIFRQYDRSALPVTDTTGMLIGIVTIDDVLDVAEATATSEIQRIGGSEALDEPYMRIGFGKMIQKRAGWLTALFLGEMLTATAMGTFEQEIQKAVVLALFVPLIISSGGNSGSQAATLVIRALALGEVGLADWWRVMRREILAGLALGAILGSIGFFRIILWSAFSDIYGAHWLLIAITVALSLVGVVLWGTLTGSLMPLLMRRLGFDPAASSAPFVATLVDVTGLVIYFSIALVILRGTLL